MGLNGGAAIVGIAEWKPERRPTAPPMFTLEQWAQLAKEALDDAGIDPREVDGIGATGIRESDSFVPSTITEYLGLEVNFAETADLGGASCAALVWRAAAAIELGIANVVVIAAPSWPSPRPPQPPADSAASAAWRYGASSPNYGSPQAEFDIPYGNVAQNCGYAPNRQPLRRRLRLGPRRARQNRRRSARLRQSQSRRRLPRRPHHDRRRAQLADDRRPDPHARNRHALRRRFRHRGRLRRGRQALQESPRLDHRFRRTRPPQDPHLRRRSARHRPAARPPTPPSTWPGAPAPTST